MRTRPIATVSLLSLWLVLAGAHDAVAASTKEVVAAAAENLAFYLKERGIDRVTPKFSGVLSFPGGNTQGFVETLKESLAPHGIRISSRADYVFDAHFERSDDESEKAFRLRLAGSVLDSRGKKLHEIPSHIEIDDGRDLAENTGVSTHFGPLKDAQARQIGFIKQHDRRTIFVSPDATTLYSNEAALYGIGVRPVSGDIRKFNEQDDGLAYTKLELGEQFVIVLINNAAHEAAVTLKLDGVNTFHFSDDAFREPGLNGGGRPKYSRWIIKPHSRVEVVGWFKNEQRSTRFKMAPLDEGAAALAKLPLDDVGLITATFAASWEGDQVPSDEPTIEKREIVASEIPKKTITKQYATIEDGKPKRPITAVPNTREVHVPYTLEVPYTSSKNHERISVGFGEDVSTGTNGVTRTTGVPRATVAFRYQR